MLIIWQRHLLPFQMGQGDCGPDSTVLPGRPRPHYTYSRKSAFKRNKGAASGVCGDPSDREDDDSSSKVVGCRCLLPQARRMVLGSCVRVWPVDKLEGGASRWQQTCHRNERETQTVVKRGEQIHPKQVGFAVKWLLADCQRDFWLFQRVKDVDCGQRNGLPEREGQVSNHSSELVRKSQHFLLFRRSSVCAHHLNRT